MADSCQRSLGPTCCKRENLSALAALVDILDRLVIGALDIVQNIVQIRTMQTISYSEARDNLKSVIDRVVASRAPIAIVRQRGEGAVLISESEWASMEETMHLLASPANARRLLDSIAEFDAGGGEEHELIEP